MNNEFTEDDLKAIASQLRCPNGEMGIEIAANMAQNNASMIRAAIRELNARPGERVLEIGFGGGAHVEEILQNHPQTHYTGIDISELMVAQAKQANAKYVKEERAGFYLTDGRSIPFENGSFDLIFSVNTLYFWGNPPAYLAEMKRVLAEKGQLILTFGTKTFLEKIPVTAYGFRMYDTGEAEQLVLEAGFRIDNLRVESEIIETRFGDTMEREFATLTARPHG